MFRQFCALLVLLGPLAGLCHAAEYRLRVANLYDKSFAAFIDGRIGLGNGELAMPRLEASLDEGAVPTGALLSDRPPHRVPAPVTASFGAVAPAPAAGHVPNGSGQWYELSWAGTPGERTVWAISASRLQYQQVTQLALKGTGPLRYYLPYTVGIAPSTYVAVTYPLGWLLRQEERGWLWSRYLARTVRLPEGIAAVAATNDNPQFSDWVYFVLENPPAPTAFKAVVAWERRRGADRWDAPAPREP